MRREDAEAQRERLQRDDHEHTYVVREQPAGAWEVVRMNLPQPSSPWVPAGWRAAFQAKDAKHAAEDADAARRLSALRERRARLANVPSEPVAPSPYVVPPDLTGLRGY